MSILFLNVDDIIYDIVLLMYTNDCALYGNLFNIVCNSMSCFFFVSPYFPLSLFSGRNGSTIFTERLALALRIPPISLNIL